MVREGHPIIQSRLALYTCEATFKLTRCFINTASESVLLHGLYRTHGSTKLPTVLFALAAAIVRNYKFAREKLCLHFANILQIQAHIKAIRTGCQAGKLCPIRVASLLTDQFWRLWDEDRFSWQAHIETIQTLEAFIKSDEADRSSGTPHMDGDPSPRPIPSPSRFPVQLVANLLPGSSPSSSTKSPSLSQPPVSPSLLQRSVALSKFQALKEEVEVLMKSVSSFGFDLINRAEEARKKSNMQAGSASRHS